MSRVTTTNLSLGAWDEGDHPGAGSKTVLSANTGLNGNWLILDAAVGVGHDSAGAHRANVIDGPNLKTTVADATTIALQGSPLKLSVIGIGSQHIVAGAVVEAGLGALSVSTGKIQDDAVTAAKIGPGAVDATAIGSDAVTTVKILNANVTAAKLEQKTYKARMSQTSTNAPVETVVIKNTFISPTIVWSRVSSGLYRASLAGGFIAAKTLALFSPYGSFDHGHIEIEQADGTVDFYCSGGDGTFYVNVMIEEYP